MNNYERRIAERQAVFDAVARGEISREEYDARLAALPKLRAPRIDDTPAAAVAKPVIGVVSRVLDAIERRRTRRQ